MSLPEPTATFEPPPPVSAHANHVWTLKDVLLLAGVLAFAFMLRVTNYDADLSLDELWHLSTTPGKGSFLDKFPADVLLPGLPSQTSLEHAAPFWHIWRGMDGVLHPPLYCLSLRLWRDAFGESDFVAHLYSTVWAMIAIGFLFATAKLAMDRWAALLCCIAASLSQAQIYFAQEVRSYQMLIGIACIALYVMARIEKYGSTRARAITLALMTLPLLLTHYFAFGAAVAIGIYGLIRCRGNRLAFVLACVSAGTIYLIAWVPFAMQQVNDLYTGDAFLHDDKFNVATQLARLSCSPWRIIIDRDYKSDRVTMIAGLLFVVPWFCVRKHRALLPWAIWLCASILTICLLDAVRTTKHLSFPRYYAVASPAVVLLIIGIAWAIDRRTAYIAGAVLTLLVAVGGRVDERMSVDSPIHAKARNYVSERIKPDEALLIYKGEAPADYADMLALTFSHDPIFRDRPTVKMLHPLSKEIVAQLPDRAWIVVFGAFPLSKDVPGALLLEDVVNVKAHQATILHVQISKPSTLPSQPATVP